MTTMVGRMPRSPHPRRNDLRRETSKIATIHLRILDKRVRTPRGGGGGKPEFCPQCISTRKVTFNESRWSTKILRQSQRIKSGQGKNKKQEKTLNPEKCEINVRQTNPMKLRKTCQAHLIISRAQLRELQKLKICPKNKNTPGPRG